MEKVKSTLAEKLYYGFGNMGSYILLSFVTVEIATYATDCLALSSDLISIFGTVILVCRFFDGISDIIMGLVIEKTRSRIGKARLWFGISIVPLTVAFFFIFCLSGLSQVGALVTISILYFLFTVVFYTMNNVSFNAELPLISEDPYDQSNMCTVNSIFTSVGSAAVGFTLPILAAFAGAESGTNSQSAWLYLVIILAAIALVGLVLSFFKLKEKDSIKAKETAKPSKGNLKVGLKALLKTKYFYLAVGMFIINYYLYLSISTVGNYYAVCVLGNKWYSTMYSILPMITMGVGLLLTPLLVKKLGKSKVLSAAILCVFLGNLIGSCAPFTFAVGIVGAMIKGLGSAIVMSQLYTLAPDMVRYIELKTGLRIEGLAASVNSAGSKIGGGLGSAAVLWTLSLCGYNSELSVQPDSAIYSFITLYWWVPAILALALLVLSLFWDINKKSDAMEKAKAEAAKPAVEAKP